MGAKCCGSNKAVREAQAKAEQEEKEKEEQRLRDEAEAREAEDERLRNERKKLDDEKKKLQSEAEKQKAEENARLAKVAEDEKLMNEKKEALAEEQRKHEVAEEERKKAEQLHEEQMNAARALREAEEVKLEAIRLEQEKLREEKESLIATKKEIEEERQRIEQEREKAMAALQEYREMRDASWTTDTVELVKEIHQSSPRAVRGDFTDRSSAPEILKGSAEPVTLNWLCSAVGNDLNGCGTRSKHQTLGLCHQLKTGNTDMIDQMPMTGFSCGLCSVQNEHDRSRCIICINSNFDDQPLLL